MFPGKSASSSMVSEQFQLCKLHFLTRFIFSTNGLHWSEEEKACMEPEDAGCDETLIEEDEHEECPSEGIKEISHRENCENFILCVNGREIQRSCPPGLHFSREIRSCVSPDIAGCETNLFTCPEHSDGINFIPNTENCTSYYLCLDGKKFPLQCESGYHWSVAQSACLPENVAKCGFDEEQEQCPEVGVLSIPNVATCESYFMCVNGVKLEQECSSGLHFSPVFRFCVPPEMANCGI